MKFSYIILILTYLFVPMLLADMDSVDSESEADEMRKVARFNQTLTCNVDDLETKYWRPWHIYYVDGEIAKHIRVNDFITVKNLLSGPGTPKIEVIRNNQQDGPFAKGSWHGACSSNVFVLTGRVEFDGSEHILRIRRAMASAPYLREIVLDSPTIGRAEEAPKDKPFHPGSAHGGND